jgi:hypothetical protein
VETEFLVITFQVVRDVIISQAPALIADLSAILPHQAGLIQFQVVRDDIYFATASTNV